MPSNTSFFYCWLSWMLLLPVVAFGQSSLVDQCQPTWDTIAVYQQRGRLQEALQLVEQLYQRLDKGTTTSDGIAAELQTYLMLEQSRALVEKEGMIHAIQRIERTLSKSNGVRQAVLQSFLAECYHMYTMDQGYRIRRRRAATVVDADIRTWTEGQLVRRSRALYLQSVQASAALLDVPIEEFRMLILLDSNGTAYRPTLYDVLLDRALSYWTYQSSDLSNASTTFYLHDSTFLAPAAVFIQQILTPVDTLSKSYQILRLYQQGLAQHRGDLAAFVELDLRRLKFVYDKSPLDNKEAFYERTLQGLLAQNGDHEATALVAHQLAKLYKDQGNRYLPFEQTEPRWLLKKAYDLCAQAIQQHPNSYGASLCQKLMNDIQYQTLSIDIERTQRIDHPMLFLLKYRNVPKVRCVLLRHSTALADSLKDRFHTDQNDYLLKQSPVKSWQVTLPNTNDFQAHRTELDAPALGAGRYWLLVYPEDGDTLRLLTKASVQVSNLRLIGRNVGEKHTYWVVDAQTGAPIAGAKAMFTNTTYKQAPLDSNRFFVTSNSTGQLSVPKAIYNSDKYYTISISHQGDTLLNNEAVYILRQDDWYPESFFKTNFFLDRGIYRPGQTVHFKGLVLDHKHRVPQPVRFKKRTIILSDQNRQTIWEKTLTTNAYGSIHDSIVLPLGVTLGELRLEDDSEDLEFYGSYANSVAFRVEEYRRPKFEVKDLPFTTTYHLGDSVRILGTATAYAGNPISSATVTYVIRREKVTSDSWYYRNAKDGVIQLEGTTQTDLQGRYTIPFFAAADSSQPLSSTTIYAYHATITVTDITGETQELEQEFNIGAQTFELRFNLPEYGFSKDLKAFPITVTPYNGTLPSTLGKISIQRLQTPDQVYHAKPWARADVFALDASNFKKRFPHRPYQQEDVVTQWQVLETVYTKAFTVDQPRYLLELDQLAQLQAGTYRVAIQVQDATGEWIKQIRYITLAKASTQALSSHLEVPDRIEPGQRFHLHLASGLENAIVFYELEDFDGVRSRRWISFKGQTTIAIPITKAYRGGGRVQLTLITEGQLYQETHTLPVSWTGQGLRVVFKSFRSTLRPGQQETWTVQIKHHKGHPMQAEVLANLYDASLDAITPYYWPRSFLKPYSPASEALSNILFETITDQAGTDTYDVFSWFMYTPFPQDRWNLLLPSKLYGDLLRNRDEWEQFFGSNMDSSALLRYSSNELFIDGIRTLNGSRIALLEASAVTAGVVHQMDVGQAINADDSRLDSAPQEGGTNFDAVTVRRNLKETVFFKPSLRTNASGTVSIEFTMNEALSKWKFMLFAHSKCFHFGYAERFVVTQKELMITPNPPRFLREGDQVEFTAKVVNLTDQVLQGKAQLLLFDALTMDPVGKLFGLQAEALDFWAEAKGSARLAWTLRVPDDWTRPVVYRVVAQAGDYSDGEEAALPVLSNRMLVTETQPLPIRGQQTKTITFDRLKTVSASPTLKHHRLTLEFNQNPAWSAVQSLPYLMEYPYECTEQMFSRYYANTLASHVANSQPQIKAVFERWRNANPTTSLSPLFQNGDLKYALLAETPWVLDAQDQAQQQKRLGLLFDLHAMQQQRNKAQQELLKRQDYTTGGFSWMPSGPSSPYITQHLVASFGHLQTLGVAIVEDNKPLEKALEKALQYLDVTVHQRYQQLLRQASRQPDSAAYLQDNHLSALDVHYLYARAFFPEVAVKEAHRAAFKHCQRQAEQYWYKQSLYLQALLGLGLHRLGDTLTPLQVVNSLRQQALNEENLGMYWKAQRGYFWHELPIERHCAMIELFDVVAQDAQAVENMKIWLLQQRQTTHWKTTKATAAACYALLKTGDNWLVEDQDITLQLGDEVVDVASLPKEAGTGYFRTAWEGDSIQTDMATIKVTNPNKHPAWGALYWQYFEQLDQITSFVETPLKLEKQLFKEVIRNNQPLLQPLGDLELVQGDKVVVRVILRVERPMEYVHMKDQRAAGLEPLSQLSEYKWQDGLGYYESTRDAATNFFFNYLPKGTYVFEYPLRVNLKGDFSNGVTTIQCMYAPEFTAHSEGVRVAVE